MDEITSKICETALNFHRYFSQEIWPHHPDVVHFKLDNTTIYPCYHNEHHIHGAIEAAKVVVQRMMDGEVYPPLNKWNTKTNLLSLDEFKTIFIIAFACHDLGNLTKTSKLFVKDNELNLNFSDHFQLETGTSEERSAELAIQLIEHFDTDNTFPQRGKDLVKHLIMQTVFNPTQKTSEDPFWLLVQYIDQVASYFFSGVPLHIASAGYLNELSVSTHVTARLPFNLKQYLSFFPDRFYQLFPDIEARERALALFDPEKKQRNLFDYYVEVPEIPINYKIDVEQIYKGKWNK